MVAARPIPLIALAPERIEREQKNALLAEGQVRQYRRRLARLMWLCAAEWVVGYGLGMLMFRVTNEALGHILFLGASLVVLMGPVWTLILWHWLEEQRK